MTATNPADAALATARAAFHAEQSGPMYTTRCAHPGCNRPQAVMRLDGPYRMAMHCLRHTPETGKVPYAPPS